jgi:site-specific recombinase XerD
MGFVVNEAIIRLALCAGLRVSELVALRVEHLALANARPQLFVSRGKRGRSRNVDVGPGLRAFLKRYLSETRPQLVRGEDPGTLLLGRTGRPLAAMQAERRWKTELRRAGLPEERWRLLGVHAGRHTFATRLLEKGRSLAYVRDQLGHANISTTSVYLGLADLLEARGIDLYEEASPPGDSRQDVEMKKGPARCDWQARNQRNRQRR